MSIDPALASSKSYTYIESPHSTNETIVLLHGNGCHSSLWGLMEPHLKHNYHLLYINLHESDEWKALREEEITWDAICKEIHGLIQQLGIQKFHMIGHSFGASLATAYASKYPRHVKTLILMSVIVFYPSKEGQQIIDHYVSMLNKYDFREIINRELIPHLTLLPDEHEQIQRIIKIYGETDKELYLKLFHLQMLKRPLEEAKQVNCPTLLLAGEKDNLYLPSLQSITASYFKNGTFLVMPNAANALFIDQPESTAAWVNDFIKKALLPKKAISRKPSISGHLPISMQVSAQDLPKAIMREQHVLNLTLFHSFQVSLNGDEIKDGWNKRYAKNILAYLAFHPNCTREEICDALFPQVSIQIALKNLRVYMNYLRKLLTLKDQTSILHTDRKNVRLNALVICDLDAYKKEIKRLEQIENREDKSTAIVKILDTIYENSFMNGIYDQWFIDYKFCLEEQFANLSLWLVNHAESLNTNYSVLQYRKLADRLLTYTN